MASSGKTKTKITNKSHTPPKMEPKNNPPLEKGEISTSMLVFEGVYSKMFIFYCILLRKVMKKTFPCFPTKNPVQITSATPKISSWVVEPTPLLKLMQPSKWEAIFPQFFGVDIMKYLKPPSRFFQQPKNHLAMFAYQAVHRQSCCPPGTSIYCQQWLFTMNREINMMIMNIVLAIRKHIDDNWNNNNNNNHPNS